jgi:hypothetical protein
MMPPLLGFRVHVKKPSEQMDHAVRVGGPLLDGPLRNHAATERSRRIEEMMMTRRTYAIAAMVVALLICAAHADAKDKDQERIRVFVFSSTDPSGFTDQAAKDRAASVKDAAAALANSKIVVVVPDAAHADVTFEITRRVNELAQTSIAKSMWKNNSWSRSSDSMQPFLYGKVAVGTYTTELRSSKSESTAHARNLAKVFEEWVRDNRAQIETTRATPESK